MQVLKDLLKIKDQEFLEKFSSVVQKERAALVDVIAHLTEMRRRQLYAKEGYSSLFSYMTEKYHYSESSAYRRIQAAKSILLFPEILDLLENGKLNLTAISLIEPHITKENGRDLINQAIGKSKNEVEFVLNSAFPKKEIFRDKIRRLPVVRVEPEEKTRMPEKNTRGENVTAQFYTTAAEVKSEEHKESSVPLKPVIVQRVKIEFVADKSVAQKIERAKEVLRHQFPSGKLEDIFNEALEALLEKKDPMRKMARIEERVRKEEKGNTPGEKQNKIPEIQTRYIPQDIRRAVWKRDQGQCSYKSPDGKRCSERGWLQVDHIMPWNLGGSSTVENLRLLCRVHNQWRVGFQLKQA